MRRQSSKEIRALVAAEIAHPTPRDRPWGTSVSYSRARDEIRLVLDSGTSVAMPRKAIAELRALPQSHMHELELIDDGRALALDVDDVHIYVPGLVRDMTGYGSKGLHPRQIARSRRAARTGASKRNNGRTEP
ncbi:MAG: hypothetical protein QOJ39_1226 [Candidatus Eremiobacteraeota bacterium]|jgi:hypothetical protein|nr:hypothetical protein [Candidatus Eremiobacteraeota bacterium]MEA2719362.1 hypothetical protein [Candidatus Eremiobacteraeota bacterium]